METQLVYLSIPQGNLGEAGNRRCPKRACRRTSGSGSDRRVFGTPNPPEFFEVRIERTHPRTLFWHSQRVKFRSSVRAIAQLSAQRQSFSRFISLLTQEKIVRQSRIRGCLKSPDSVIFHRLCFSIPASKQIGANPGPRRES